ncbi:hypothetical protein BD770DRAFT_426287 [Pilaira anomala]|nr:hypothetical protein BD770DRAFT_426287 [Pilaira anomala]
MIPFKEFYNLITLPEFTLDAFTNYTADNVNHMEADGQTSAPSEYDDDEEEIVEEGILDNEEDDDSECIDFSVEIPTFLESKLDLHLNRVLPLTKVPVQVAMETFRSRAAYLQLYLNPDINQESLEYFYNFFQSQEYTCMKYTPATNITSETITSHCYRQSSDFVLITNMMNRVMENA